MSLDDSIVTRRNLVLLDNLTNYDKPSIDYFHHNFAMDGPEVPLTWALLLRTKAHGALRLPSCAMEDDQDYANYLVRLHHCLWRRWSLHYYGLSKSKLDPLNINWKKESDVNVLYGPDLTGHDLLQKNRSPRPLGHCSSAGALAAVAAVSPVFRKDATGPQRRRMSVPTGASTGVSTGSGIDSNKEIKFVDNVLRRDIDSKGKFRETTVDINDCRNGKASRKKNDSSYVVHNMPFPFDNRHLFTHTPDEDPFELDLPIIESPRSHTKPRSGRHSGRYRNRNHQKPKKSLLKNKQPSDITTIREEYH